MKGKLVGLITNRRWPLHPRPSEWEDLETWVRRIAEAYGVSYDAFSSTLWITPGAERVI